MAGLLLVIVYGIGTFGYYLLGQGRWSVPDCLYMTVISLTTVGYAEVLGGLNEVPYARLFTGVLLVAGAGIALYFVSILTTFLVEGEFLQIRRRRKMEKLIKKLADHIIVCGVGDTGKYVVRELVATQWDFVAIDNDRCKLDRCQEAFPKAPVIEGDATSDRVLLEAGIERAHGIVATLPSDAGNLYVVVTAKGLNPSLRIVARAIDPLAVHKLEVAGAASVVSVNRIGGLRMVSEMIRPSVTTFLDVMMHDKDKNLRFEEVVVPDHSSLVNARLSETDIRKERNLLIVAVKDPKTNSYIYSPGPQFVLEAGMTLILLGETAAVQRLRRSRSFRDSD
jgi:voltage-gated potassium channel